MINRVVLVGRLTRDVEVRKTSTGLSVADFTVACDRRSSKSQDGNEKTADFINCTAWRQSADFLGQYAKKGAIIGVDGRLQTSDYERDGQRIYRTVVIADNVRLLESRAQSEARAQQSSSDGYQDSYQPSYDAEPAVDDVVEDFEAGSGLDLSNDDLPF